MFERCSVYSLIGVTMELDISKMSLDEVKTFLEERNVDFGRKKLKGCRKLAQGSTIPPVFVKF